MASASPSTDSKFCSGCRRELPREQFRLRRAIGTAREGRCRSCYNAYMRDYRRHRRSQGIDRFVAQCLRSDAAAVEALCTNMIRRFGGIEGFSRVWKAEYDLASASAPGSRRVCNMLMAIVRVLETVDSQRPPPDFSQLSDQELDDAKREAILDLIRGEPLIAVAAAQLVGWTVIPPEDSPVEYR